MFEAKEALHSDDPQIWEAIKLHSRFTLLRKVPVHAYLWGVFPPGPWVSIIGTRRPTQVGEKWAFELARQLAILGVSILSGGAKGIDSAAHRGALEGGGKTLVVAPTWLKSAYPTENRQLFSAILSNGGGYLSIAEEAQQPFNSAFFYRNELLAALSDVVVLGDCPLRSGARNAMHHARRLGKPRFCLPIQFDCDVSFGNWLENRDLGAVSIANVQPILGSLDGLTDDFGNALWSTAQLVRAKGNEASNRRSSSGKRLRGLPKAPIGTHPGAALPKTASTEMKLVAEALRTGCLTADEVAEQTGLVIGIIQHQILLLTLSGLVFQDASGVLRYQALTHD